MLLCIDLPYRTLCLAMNLRIVLIVVLLLLLLGALPTVGLHEFGYYPSGALATILIVILVLMLLGVI